MRADLILLGSCVLIGFGNTFQITDFLSSPFSHNNQRQLDAYPDTDQLTERQDGGSVTQIFAVFLIAFGTSVLTNLIFLSQIPAASTPTEEEEFVWCYKDPKCDQFAWNKNVPICQYGIRQSPIDVDFTLPEVAEGTEYSTPLTFVNHQDVRTDIIFTGTEEYGLTHHNNITEEFKGRAKKLKNKGGKTAQIDVKQDPASPVGVLRGGPLTEDYHVVQIHWHWGRTSSEGSEHTYKGQKFPMEMHIVHGKKSLLYLDDGLAKALTTVDGLSVTGFQFETQTADNTALTPLIEGLKQITNADSDIAFLSTSFNLKTLIDPSIGGRYATYEGGLTTPTCNEVVRWLNFETALKISEDQISVFRKLMDGKGGTIYNNYRSPQPLNGREVKVIKTARRRKNNAKGSKKKGSKLM